MGVDDSPPEKEHEASTGDKTSHVSISKQVEATEGLEKTVMAQLLVGIILALIILAVIGAVYMARPVPHKTYSKIVVDRLYPGLPYDQTNNSSAKITLDLILTNTGDADSGNLTVEVRAMERDGSRELMRHKKTITLSPITSSASRTNELNITVVPSDYRIRFMIYEDEVRIEEGYADVTVIKETGESNYTASKESDYFPDFNQDQAQDELSGDWGVSDDPAPGVVPSMLALICAGMLLARYRRK